MSGHPDPRGHHDPTLTGRVDPCWIVTGRRVALVGPCVHALTKNPRTGMEVLSSKRFVFRMADDSECPLAVERIVHRAGSMTSTLSRGHWRRGHGSPSVICSNLQFLT